MRTVRFGNGTINIRTGTEGPRHDPYGFTEIIVTIRGVEYLYHAGLGEYIKIGGVEVEPINVVTENSAIFEFYTGFFPHQWENFYHRATSRCQKCGCRSTRSVAGYPGESFDMCTNCDEVVQSHFHLSEIE